MIDALCDLVNAEKGLTKALEHASPLLCNTNSAENIQLSFSSSPIIPMKYPLLPTPRDLNAAKEVLALSRALSSRSSLPPFPNQLRGGALGLMQRKMTKLERSRKDKQRLQEEEQKEQNNKKQRQLELEQKEKEEKQLEEKRIQDEAVMNTGGGQRRSVGFSDPRRRGAQQPRVERTFVNLSSSSSEEDSDEEDDENEDEDDGSEESK